MAEIVVTTEGFERVFAITDKLANPNWRELLDVIGMTVTEQSVNHFTQQAGPEGAWAPRISGGSWPILIKTGTLRGNISHAVYNMEVVIGTHLFYAKFHQFGTRHMVKRMFLGLTDTDKSELTQVVESYFERLTHS